MKKFLAFLLVLMMTVPMLMVSASASEVTTLVTISLGSKPGAYDEVIAAVNEYAGEKYGLNLEVRFLDWDPSKAYPIIMNTGDGVDLVFFSSWPGSQNWARQGAFVDLEEIIKTEYKDLWNAIPESTWDAVRVDGHIYSVPAPEASFNANYGMVYRADLCEKYNLPVPNSIENIEKYCDGILANEPGVEPLVTAFDRDMQYSRFETLLLDAQFGLVVTESYDNINKYWGTPEHLEELKLAREWMVKGYFTRDLMNDTIAAHDKFINGMGALMNDQHLDGYLGKLQGVVDLVKAGDTEKATWEVAYYPYNVDMGKVLMISPAGNNGTGISYVYSDHIKESLTFLQAVFTDSKLHWLIRYGVEGVHYDLTPEGYYHRLTNNYESCGMSLWNWRSDELSLEGPVDERTKAAAAFNEQFKKCEPYFTNFSFDSTPVKDEIGNLAAVTDQYLKPLRYGLIEDVEAGLKEFMEKAEQAGLSKVQEEYLKQYNAYLEANK